MVKCDKCLKKIGFFGEKHKYENSDSKDLIYCSMCNDTFLEKQYNQNFEGTRSILERYIYKYSVNDRARIHIFFQDEEILDTIEEDSIINLSTYIKTRLEAFGFLIETGNYENLSNIMVGKELFSFFIILLNDFEKIYKIIHRKGFIVNYLELTNMFRQILDEELEKEKKDFVDFEYSRISLILGENITIESVIKEFVLSPTIKAKLTAWETDLEAETLVGSEFIDTLDIREILYKFNLDIDDDSLWLLIWKLNEVNDLDSFENNIDVLHDLDKYNYHQLDGLQFESFLEELFNSLGYVAKKTKASSDQGADLILMKDGVMTVVQAKRYTGNVSNKAIQEAVAAKKYYDCPVAMVVTTGKFTKGAIELAIVNDVDLWDGQKLDEVVSTLSK